MRAMPERDLQVSQIEDGFTFEVVKDDIHILDWRYTLGNRFLQPTHTTYDIASLRIGP